MNKISIIIPVYNVEPYVRRCLDSVINQTYTNLEILLIDDGSTDNGGKICDEYAEKDNRIKIFHKPNGGVASARNIGLNNFTGDFLGFLDPDDWAEPEMFEVLYNVLRKNNVSFSTVSYYFEYDDHCETACPREKIDNRVLTSKEILLYMFRGNYYAGFLLALWNKLFRVDIIKNNNLSFDETARAASDAKFTTDIVLTQNCTSFFCNKPLYHYYQRDLSISNIKINKNEFDRLRILNEIIIKAGRCGYDDITIWLKRDHCYRASQVAEKALESGDKEAFLLAQSEMNIYLTEYIQTNKEYPERIERINKLTFEGY